MTDYGNPVQDFSVGQSLFLKSNENLNCHQAIADVVTFIFLTAFCWSLTGQQNLDYKWTLICF